MSIKGKDVLERILLDVYSADSIGFRPERRVHSDGSWVGIMGPGCAREQHASVLHFWGHALRSALGDRDPEFVGMAEDALCERIPSDRTRQVFREECGWDLDPVLHGYRMFDDASRRSYVAETPTDYCAFFWEHTDGPPVLESVVRAVVRCALGDAIAADVVQVETQRQYAWRVDAGRVAALEPAPEQPDVRFFVRPEFECLDVQAWRDGWSDVGRFRVEWTREVASLVALP